MHSTTPTSLPPPLANLLPNPQTPWHISKALFQRLQAQTTTSSTYRKCEITQGDPEWAFIQQYFQAQRPLNRSISRAYCIHNPHHTNQFEAAIPTMEQEAQSPHFAPRWNQEDLPTLRQKVIHRFRTLAAPYSPFSIQQSNQRKDTYTSTKVLPFWHGTKASIAHSICQTGFTYFGKHQFLQNTDDTQSTDVGFFGSGIYFTTSARYAADIYSDGNLLLAWVSLREPYPVVADDPQTPSDMQKLGQGLGAYQNYNAHYIPVISINPSDPMCPNYYPCTDTQNPAWDEIVVFQKSQTLARFWVELQPDLLPNPAKPLNPTTIHYLLEHILDLLEKEVVKQDPNLVQVLEQKSELLIILDPNQTLTSQDQEFYQWTTKLFDTQGKVRTFVHKKLQQIQAPQAPAGSAAPSSPQPQPSHTYKMPPSPISSPSLQPPPPIAVTPKPIIPSLPSKGDFSNLFTSALPSSPQPQPSHTYKAPPSPISSPSLQPSPPIVLTSKSIIPSLPFIAFGKAKWATYFGDVGAEPPLPPDIHQILQSPCPFWPGKKVEETHLLILIPRSVNGQPLTLKTLGKLVGKPKQGPATKYRYLGLGEYQDQPTIQSYWVLMTRDVIEGSRNKTYADQKQLVATYAQKTGVAYELPKILEATTCIFLHHVSTGQKLYPDSPWTYTRCQELYHKQKGRALVVGGFAAGGLHVIYHSRDHEYVGVGCRRKF